MTEYEQQQLILQQQILEQQKHISGQLDLLHQTIYSASNYVMYEMVSVMFCAALLMFLVGYKVARGN